MTIVFMSINPNPNRKYQYLSKKKSSRRIVIYGYNFLRILRSIIAESVAFWPCTLVIASSNFGLTF